MKFKIAKLRNICHALIYDHGHFWKLQSGFIPCCHLLPFTSYNLLGV
jgi:hypothetical protein